jgi:hypothetical protein
MDIHKLMERVVFDRRWDEQRSKASQRDCLPTKYQQNIAKLRRLERETLTMATELEIGKRLEAAQKRNLEVKMKLQAANRSLTEQKAYDAERRRGQILFANVVAENHPDWRSQPNPNLELYRKQYPTHQVEKNRRELVAGIKRQ